MLWRGWETKYAHLESNLNYVIGGQDLEYHVDPVHKILEEGEQVTIQLQAWKQRVTLKGFNYVNQE